MSVSEDDFKDWVSNFASGVTVVTMEWEESYLGLTVSSFCSVSLEPPLVSVCVEKDGRTHDPLIEETNFTVNFLAEDQVEVSNRFAHPGLSMNKRFDETEYRTHDRGGPIIRNSLGWMVCKAYDQFPGGDHSIFLGEVIDGETTDGKPPLLYYKGSYGEYTQRDD